MDTTKALAADVGVLAACEAIGVARASFYRGDVIEHEPAPRPTPARALSVEERCTVLDTLNSERFVDAAPEAVHAMLLDDGKYLCSPRTMYRLLAEHAQLRERRAQLRHPEYKKPELIATAPNQVWTWDITKLKGPVKWTYFHLYVILDMFSRYVVGWMLATCESSELARHLLAETIEKQGIRPGQLHIHADRGTAMTSKPVAQLLFDLGVIKTHSRPHVSDDNPYSEAQFKTLKYRPGFPDRFGSHEDGLVTCRRLIDWYNTEHRHGGIARMTPKDVHYGRAPQVAAQRQQVLDAAYEAHPDRFVRRHPTVEALPTAVWINEPVPKGGPIEPPAH